MRKILLSSTSLLAAATIASYASADVSVTGNFDWKYRNIASNLAASDGTQMAQDHEVVISFSNKTDSGLTVGGRYDVDADTDGIDESSISIAGGFGTLVLGANDGVSDAFGVTEQDLINDEPHLSKFSAYASASSTASVGIATNAGEVNASGDANKIAYFTPAMGGFKAGYSMADSGAGANSDNTTDMGFSYSMPLEGGSVLAEYNQSNKDGDTDDAEFKAKNYGVTVTMGALSFIASTMSAQEATAGSNILTEDIEATGVAVKYDLGGGLTIAASSMESEDSAPSDVSATGDKEKYSSNIGEVSYSIAPGLTANITYNDYDYKIGGTSNTADGGSITQLTINASF
jgi:hypothetical protein